MSWMRFREGAPALEISAPHSAISRIRLRWVLLAFTALTLAFHPALAVQAHLSSDWVITLGHSETVVGYISSDSPGRFQALIMEGGSLLGYSEVEVEHPLEPGVVLAEFTPRRAGNHVIELVVRDSMGRILATDSMEIKVIPALPAELASMLPQARPAGSVEIDMKDASNIQEWDCDWGQAPDQGIIVFLPLDKTRMPDQPKARLSALSHIYDLVAGRDLNPSLWKETWGCPVQPPAEYTCVDSASGDGYTLKMHFKVRKIQGKYELILQKVTVEFPGVQRVADPDRAMFSFCAKHGEPGLALGTAQETLKFPHQQLELRARITKPDKYKAEYTWRSEIADGKFGVVDEHEFSAVGAGYMKLKTPLGYDLRFFVDTTKYWVAWPTHPDPNASVVMWAESGELKRPPALPGVLRLNSTQPETQYAISPVGCIPPEKCAGTVGLEPVEISLSPGNYTIACSKPGYVCVNCPINVSLPPAGSAEALCQMQPALPAFFNVEQVLANGKPCPATIALGQSVEVSARIRNVGGEQAAKTVVLSRDGIELRSWDITLGPGEATSVSHTDTPREPGDYTYRISTPDKSLSCVVSVAFAVPAWVWILAAGGGVLGAVAAVRLRRR